MELARHRTSLGLSLEDCARALGLSPTSKGWLSEIENGKRHASLRLALRIEAWSEGRVPAHTVCPEVAVVRGIASRLYDQGEAA